MWVVEHLGVGVAPLCLETSMNLINELRMLAEDLHVNGYNRCSAVVSKAAYELDKWEAVFGHLGGTPDECGNAIIAARDELLDRLEVIEKSVAMIERVEKMEAALQDHHANAMCKGCDHSHPLTQLRLSAYQQSKLYADTVSALEKSK